MEQPKPTPIREIDFLYYIKHYFLVIWRWKWWILIAGPVAAAVALVYMVKFAPPEPELSTTTLIGIENTASASAVMMDFVEFDNSKAELITTRSFLSDIVSKLSLQMVLKEYARSAVFKTVLSDSTAKPGKYVLSLDTDNNKIYTISYTNRRLGYKNKVISTGKITNLDLIKLPGIFLEFSSNYLQDPFPITFYIVSVYKAIDNLHAQLSIKRPDFRRKMNYIEVSLSGRDYNLITEILNTIADAFVQKKLNFKRRKALNVLKALEKQYKKAKYGLSIAESRLRSYRTQNPTVGLTQNTQQTVNSMIEMETNTFAIKNSLKDAERLYARYQKTAPSDKIQVGEEILIFLNTQNNTTSPVLQLELNRLISDQRALKQNHMDDHPSLQKKQEEINSVLEKAHLALNQFVHTTQDKLWEKNSGMKSLSQKLQRLPSKELQLAELQRQHKVNAEIYSTVLDRYNKAKVAETVEVADTYVMDYAVPPIPPPTNLLELLGMCLLIGLGIAFAPPVVSDMIRKTARTEFELHNMTGMLVLESIPKITPRKISAQRKD